MTDQGASVPEQALVSDQAPAGLAPAGFDPSRRFRLLGFATGWYIGRCTNCDARFMGDKRASTCLACAAIEADHAILRLRQRAAELESQCGKALEYQLVDLLDPARIKPEQSTAIWEVLKCIAAQAIEARRAETLCSVHESAVAGSNAPDVAIPIAEQKQQVSTPDRTPNEH